jgi:hypothetical protein
MIFITFFVRGQDFIIRNTSSGIDGPTTFLQTNLFPTSTTTSSKLEVGKSFNALNTRSIFYGGNLGVSQSTSTYGTHLGKWSFTGAWDKLYTTSSPSTVLGNDFLVNYHRWDDYMANFGLRAASTSISGGSSTPSSMKDAVVSWGYERGQTPNRLIFQSIEGVDYNGNTTNPDHYEWATILSNGNIGSGISNPSAQFQLKPLSSPGTPLFEILDGSSNPMFTFIEGGIGGTFNTKGQHIITSPTGVTSTTYKPFSVFDKTGTGFEIFSILDNGSTTMRACSLASLSNKVLTLKNSSGTDIFYIQNDGGTLLRGNLFLLSANSSSNPLQINSSTANSIFMINDDGITTFKSINPSSSTSVFEVNKKILTTPDQNLLKITDAGNVYFSKYGGTGTKYLKVNNDGLIFSDNTPFTANSVWEITGNNLSAIGGTHKFGGINSVSTTYDHQIDFYVGNQKAFKIYNDHSHLKYAFTDFVRNVSIQGGTPHTSSISGSSAPNDEEWSLTVKTALDPTTLTYYSLADYQTKGILRCINADNHPVLLVGGNEIGIGHGCGLTGTYNQNTPTTTFRFGDCSLSLPTYDKFDLMRPDMANGNEMDIWGKLDVHNYTRFYDDVYPTSGTPVNLGIASTNEWANIYGTNIYGNIIEVNTSVTADLIDPLNAGVSNIGSISNAFNEIWGDKIKPYNGGTTATFGASSYIGTSTNWFDEIHAGTVYGASSALISDKRLKENIKPIESTLNIIKKLNPVEFNFIKKPNQLEYGFIAQELDLLLPNVVLKPNENNDHYYVLYTTLIPVLAKGMQEQQLIIDSLKQKLDLVFSLNQIKENKNATNQKESINQLPLLFQNHPNPFNGFTFIDYFLPDNITDAFIRVIDNNGKLLKAFPLNKTGFGQIELDCSNLASGTYHYSLLVNSKLIDTKSMIITEAN